MMHVVTQARVAGGLCVGSGGACFVHGRADVGFRQGEHPNRMQTGGVESLRVDVTAQRGVEPPTGLDSLRERQVRRELEDDEPVGVSGFGQAPYVGARERLAWQMLQDEVGDDEVERAGGRLLGGGEGDVGRVGVEAARLLEHLLGDVDADGLVESVRKGAGEPADAAAEVECPTAPRGPAEFRRRREDLLDLGLTGGKELVGVPAPVAFAVDAEHGPKRVDLREVVPVPGFTRLRRMLPHSLDANSGEYSQS
jgi:hypothetical protein